MFFISSIWTINALLHVSENEKGLSGNSNRCLMVITYNSILIAHLMKLYIKWFDIAQQEKNP